MTRPFLLIVLMFGIILNISKISGQVKDLSKAENSSVIYDAIKNPIGIGSSKTKSEDVCNTCKIAVDELIHLRRSGAKKGELQNIVLSKCPSWSGWSKEVCEGFISIEADVVLYIIDNKNDLTGERVCSIFLQKLGCTDANRVDWDINIPPEPSPNEIVHRINLYAEDDFVTPGEDLKVLHLTDFHFDPLYKPYSNSKCDLQLCCQEKSGEPNGSSSTAGYWGDYNFCDMPWHSVDNLLYQIKIKHPKIDLVYYTGDIISHRSWDTNITSNSRAIVKLYNKFAKVFGKVPVLPVLGNHEPHPTDFWAPQKTNGDNFLTTKWLFNLISFEWSKWLPKSAQDTLKKGGYYTVLLPNKLRIIGLNSNVCYTSNIWLFYEDKDPYNQLQWLVDTLKLAEAAGESVHILSHVPPGHVECLKNWNDVYNKIVSRFARTIKAQFNGHTHYDELRLHYNKDGNEVINVAFNGGSFTTFVGLNPNYRMYDVSINNFMVNNYEQWTYNMSAANEKPKFSPEWYKLYTFKEAYGMKSLSLEEFGRLVGRMSTNKTIMQDYFRYHVRNSDIYMARGCDDECLQAKLCALKSTTFKEAFLCNDS